MNKEAKAIIISSVSGGGKTTLAHLLQKKMPQLALALTATTRSPRGKEKHAQDYYFYTHEEFLRKIERGEFLEYAEVHKNYYGIPKEPFTEQLALGTSVILNIDVQGMQTIKAKLGAKRVIDIFLMPPSKAIWEQRLRNRGTLSKEQCQMRFKNGEKEMEEAPHYSHIITNSTIEETIGAITKILKHSLSLDSPKISTAKKKNLIVRKQ